MKSLSGKELAKKAEAKGWILIRTKGSHHIYSKSGYVERLVIPIHGATSLKMGLQKALMKIIPLSENEL